MEVPAQAGQLSRVRQAAYAALANPLRQVARDERGYVVDLSDNFLPRVDLTAIRADFERGAGRELDTKMRAPWSSAALAANAFGPWRLDPSTLPLDGGPFRDLRFEERCATGLRGTQPHLDAVAVGPDVVVGIESKCTEILAPKQAMFSASYDTIADFRSRSPWFRQIAVARREPHRYRLLDVAQLVKHYLGLSRCYRGKHVKLSYLYWEPLDADRYPVFRRHREEVERFGEAVAGDPDVQFLAASYEVVWSAWVGREQPVWLPEHLGNLRARYSAELAPFLAVSP